MCSLSSLWSCFNNYVRQINVMQDDLFAIKQRLIARLDFYTYHHHYHYFHHNHQHRSHLREKNT